MARAGGRGGQGRRSVERFEGGARRKRHHRLSDCGGNSPNSLPKQHVGSGGERGVGEENPLEIVTERWKAAASHRKLDARSPRSSRRNPEAVALAISRARCGACPGISQRGEQALPLWRQRRASARREHFHDRPGRGRPQITGASKRSARGEIASSGERGGQGGFGDGVL